MTANDRRFGWNPDDIEIMPAGKGRGSKREGAKGGARTSETRSTRFLGGPLHPQGDTGVDRRDLSTQTDGVPTIRAGRVPDGPPGQSRRGDPDDRRFHPGRTHKASSAEDILRHCLRRRGWSGEWRRRELTGGQSLDLLGDIRDYGMAWLHHEAARLFRAHGRGDERRLHPGVRGGDRLRDAPGSGGELAGTPGPDAAQAGRLTDGQERPARNEGEACGGAGRSQPGDAGPLSEAALADHEIPAVARALGTTARSHVGRFFQRARRFVHELITAGAMAMAGPAGLTAEDIADADHAAQVQAHFLDHFEQEVVANPPAALQPAAAAPPAPPTLGVVVLPAVEPSGKALREPMTAAEFAARAESYGGSVWAASVNADRKRTIRSGKFQEERRFHKRPRDRDHPCGTCEAESRKGWVPIGTLKELGDSECLGIFCDCAFTYRTAA